MGLRMRLVRFKRVGLWIGVRICLGYVRKRIWKVFCSVQNS